MPSLWLVGMMGSGKTTVGRETAKRADITFIDTDQSVIEKHGSSISRLWQTHGESAFRRLEDEAVAEAARARPAVVATGGGAVLNESNVATMRASGVVIWLDATPSVLAQRVGSDLGRPLLAERTSPEAALAQLLEQRSSSYRRAAHAIVSTDDLTVDEVVEEVMAAWTGS